MRRRIVLLTMLLMMVFGLICVAEAALTHFNGIKLCGKVKVVKHFADIKVQVVDHFPDLRVKRVKHFPDDIGEWQFVNYGEDFTIQYVDAFPDLKIKFVEHFPG